MLIYTCIYYIYNILYIYDIDYVYNIYNVLLFMAIYNDTICIRSIIYDAEAETPVLGHPMQRVVSFVKTLRLGKIEGRRRRG